MLHTGLGQCIIALHLLYQDKEYIHLPLNFKMFTENLNIADIKGDENAGPNGNSSEEHLDTTDCPQHLELSRALCQFGCVFSILRDRRYWS